MNAIMQVNEELKKDIAEEASKGDELNTFH